MRAYASGVEKSSTGSATNNNMTSSCKKRMSYYLTSINPLLNNIQILGPWMMRCDERQKLSRTQICDETIANSSIDTSDIVVLPPSALTAPWLRRQTHGIMKRTAVFLKENVPKYRVFVINEGTSVFFNDNVEPVMTFCVCFVRRQPLFVCIIETPRSKALKIGSTFLLWFHVLETTLKPLRLVAGATYGAGLREGCWSSIVCIHC